MARHGQLRSPGVVGQLLKFLGIAVSVVLVSAVGVAAYVSYDVTSTIQENSVPLTGQEEVPPNISEWEGGFNMLVVGVDVCEPEYASLFPGRCDEGGSSDAALNDVNILLHVSDAPRKVTAVSFPRDLMLEIPSCVTEDGDETSAMRKQQLNVAFSTGGLDCVARTITNLTGQEIGYAAKVTFGGVIEITSAIGGVEVCLASPIKDYHTGLDMQAGDYTLSGYEALQFLRTRHGVGDGSDLGRISNQQQYMTSLVNKLRSEGVLSDVPTMLRLVGAALKAKNVQTSESLANHMTLVQVGLAVKDVPAEDIVFLQYPTFTDPDDTNRVVADKSSATVMWDAINANQQLVVTHENTDNDGVVIEPDAVAPDGTETTSPDGTETTTPDAGVVDLPSNIKGNAADTQTCSNGKIYG